MISTLDHTTVLVPDLDAGVAAYREIFAREPAFRTKSDGAQSAFFTLDNATLRITAPQGEASFGSSARAALEENGEGLRGLTFGVDSIEQTHRRLNRLSLRPDETTHVTRKDLAVDTTRSWKRSGLPAELSHGVQISFKTPLTETPRSVVTRPAPVLKMDLVVVATDDPERALALYGVRLGLSLIFDRTNPERKTRLMQFACGDMLIKVVHSATDRDKRKPDRLWGIAWSVADADAARERLVQAGRNVSDVKAGAKPGTRVFTLRDGTCNVPTLFVQHLPTQA